MTDNFSPVITSFPMTASVKLFAFPTPGTKSKADEQQNHTSAQTAAATKMKSDTKKAKVAAGQPKNKSTSSQSKTILKSTMKKDASKAQKISQNIGKQKTTTKKVAKVGHKPPSQKQVFKDLYDKVFGR